MTASPGLVGSLAPAVPPGHCPNEGSRHRPARLRLASPSGARVGAAPPSSSAGARARSFRGLRWFPGAASRRFEVRAAEVLQLWSVASAPSVWCACRGCRAAVECDSPSALPARSCLCPPSHPNPQRGAARPAPRIGRVDPGGRCPAGQVHLLDERSRHPQNPAKVRERRGRVTDPLAWSSCLLAGHGSAPLQGPRALPRRSGGTSKIAPARGRQYP
jgi:hypothetical protein